MIDPIQLRDFVIRPVLRHLEPEIPYSLAAEHLLLGTAAQESRLRYLHQLGRGPAVGLWQMEPFTYDDLWKTTLAGGGNALAAKVRILQTPGFSGGSSWELAGNLYLACAMSRVFYRRIREALPPAYNVRAMGMYWKRYYNTMAGKGTVEEFIRNWDIVAEAIGGEK